jgi:hypothetical protein
MGDPEKVAELKALVGKPIQDREGKTLENPIFSFMNIISPPADKMDEYHGVRGFEDGVEKGNTEFNWYAFNNREWGTKWDVANHGEDFEETLILNESATSITYNFSTAWCGCEPVIKKLSEMFPELELTYTYTEEQGWGAYMEFDNGVCEEYREWDVPSNHEENIEHIGSCWKCENFTSADTSEELFEDCPLYAETLAREQRIFNEEANIIKVSVEQVKAISNS